MQPTRFRIALREAAWISLISVVLGFGYTAVASKGMFSPVAEGKSGEEKATPPLISLDEARALFQNGSALFVDARHGYDFGLGHIKGAINIPLSEFEIAAALLESVPKETHLVTYCDGEECNSSKELAIKLDSLGFTNVRVFFGGWKEWEANNLPVTQ